MSCGRESVYGADVADPVPSTPVGAQMSDSTSSKKISRSAANGGRGLADHFLPGERNVPRAQRIYTNRNLRMEQIEAIGFDMDHTLALYDGKTFEQLTFDMAVQTLVAKKGYPEIVREIRYQPDFIIRGLVVDKKLGNLLKMDSHGYIAVAYHGTRKLDREERLRAYRNLRVNLRSERYQSFDTLFSMPEGSLFAAVVDLKESDRSGAMKRIRRAQIFDDVRDSVDTVHRDGSLKSVIMQDLERYFIEDPGLRPTLLRFRALGKKLFLLTNSEYEYTEAVMSHVLADGGGDWKDLFDLVICSSRKPDFFLDGAPAQAVPGTQRADGRDFVFLGGNAGFIENSLGAKGDQVLYFGDHTYGDILRSKKTVGWRTAMIVYELEHEIRIQERRAHLASEVRDLVARSQDLSRDRDQLALLLRTLKSLLLRPAEAQVVPDWAHGYTAREIRDVLALEDEERAARMAELENTLDGLDFLVAQTESRAAILEGRVRDSYNPHWGWLFREENKISRFARQVKEFACIYTSRVANFRNYPGNFYFIAPEERMPHEL